MKIFDIWRKTAGQSHLLESRQFASKSGEAWAFWSFRRKPESRGSTWTPASAGVTSAAYQVRCDCPAQDRNIY